MAGGKAQGRPMGEVIKKAWSDEAFKAKLLSNTMAALKENGIAIPEGVTVKAVENTDKVFYLIIPPKPGVRELSDEDLNKAAGGTWGVCSECCGQAPFDGKN